MRAKSSWSIHAAQGDHGSSTGSEAAGPVERGFGGSVNIRSNGHGSNGIGAIVHNSDLWSDGRAAGHVNFSSYGHGVVGQQFFAGPYSLGYALVAVILDKAYESDLFFFPAIRRNSAAHGNGLGLAYGPAACHW